MSVEMLGVCVNNPTQNSQHHKIEILFIPLKTDFHQ